MSECALWERRGNITPGLIALVCPPERLELYIAKIIPANPRRLPLALGVVTEALKWCIRKKVHIVCMNWVIPHVLRGQQKELDEFIAVIREAHKANIIMFCPGKRSHQRIL